MPVIAVYARSLFTESNGNFNSVNPPAIGATLQYNGGAHHKVSINDDDNWFDDGAVDSGVLQTTSSALTFDGTTYAAGSTIELEWVLRDDGTPNDVMAIAIDGTVVGYAFGSTPVAGTTWTQDQPDQGNNSSYITTNDTDFVYANYSTITCFVAGTRIKTNTGWRCIEKIAPGDLISTIDNGLQPVKWVSCQHHSSKSLQRNPKAHPVHIKKGALADGLPERDLTVSPQHRILAQSPIVARIFGVPEILVPAKKLTGLDGVDILKPFAEVTYYNLLFDDHQLIVAEGAVVESLLLGEESLKSIPSAVLNTLKKNKGDATVMRPVRPIARGHQQLQLVARHRKNSKSFQIAPFEYSPLSAELVSAA